MVMYLQKPSVVLFLKVSAAQSVQQSCERAETLRDPLPSPGYACCHCYTRLLFAQRALTFRLLHIHTGASILVVNVSPCAGADIVWTAWQLANMHCAQQGCEPFCSVRRHWDALMMCMHAQLSQSAPVTACRPFIHRLTRCLPRKRSCCAAFR